MTSPAPITAHTAELIREMRKEQAPSIADALRNLVAACDAHLFTNDYCGLECTKSAAPIVDKAIEAAHTALAALSEPQDEPELSMSMFASAADFEAARASLAPAPSCCAECGRKDGDGWALYCVDCMTKIAPALAPAPQPASQGEVPMPEPVGAVIPEGSTEYADCVTLGQCRAYGDARAAAERERCAKLCHEYAAQISITDFQRHTARQLAAAIDARALAAAPNLTPVIAWLEAGCDPKEAAKELRIYQATSPSALAAVREPLSDEQIARHSIAASECPPSSQVILVSSLRRLLGITAQAQQEPTQ